jgi:hypothetical protein
MLNIRILLDAFIHLAVAASGHSGPLSPRKGGGGPVSHLESHAALRLVTLLGPSDTFGEDALVTGRHEVRDPAGGLRYITVCSTGVRGDHTCAGVHMCALSTTVVVPLPGCLLHVGDCGG